MTARTVKTAPPHFARIWMAGDVDHAKRVARAYCDEVGECVTVTPTEYIFTEGQVGGFVVGLINYPRFPRTQEKLYDDALALAKLLRVSLGQESFSIETSQGTYWHSWRNTD